MQYIIFDFNGTVVNDVAVSLKAINCCIEKYLKRGPLSMDEYLHVFTFPIQKYYEDVGFNWNDGYSYEEVGQVWYDKYREYKNEYKVFEGVVDVLKKNHELGNKNILLSASHLETLKIQLQELEISEYFDEVLGIENIYAASKIDIAVKWMQGKNPNDCKFIGDSLHDLETANAMGIKDTTLVARGHQAKDVLLKEYNNVVDDIRQVKI